MKVLLIPAIAPGFRIFRRRPCSSQVNAVYTNGVCCANYSHHNNLLAAEDVAHPTEHGVPSSITFECSVDGSLCFPQGCSGRRLTPAPSSASGLSQEHGPGGSLGSISDPPAPTKPKTFYCPWENMRGREVALLCSDPFLAAPFCHQPGISSTLLKKAERVQKQ